MSDKCTGIMGRIFGHSFAVAVTKSAVRGAPRLQGTAYALTKMLDAHRDETYCGIYCKRCGKVINS